MADFMIRARNAPGGRSKGDIVVVKESGAPRGGRETLPDYVWVEVPSVTRQQVRDYMQAWITDFRLDVVTYDVTTDVARLRLWNDSESASGVGRLVKSEVADFLNDWRADNVAQDGSEVRFDLDGALVVRSVGFWGMDLADFSATDTFDSDTRIRTVTADYTEHPEYLEDPRRFALWMRARVRSQDCMVLSNKDGVIEFEVEHSDIRSRIIEDLRERREGLVGRRRYYVGSSAVDQVIDNGGSMQVTATQLQNNVHDRVTE